MNSVVVVFMCVKRSKIGVRVNLCVLAVSGRRRQTFESVCSSVGAEQRQSHRVQTLLQTFHTVDLHRVIIGLKERNR